MKLTSVNRFISLLILATAFSLPQAQSQPQPIEAKSQPINASKIEFTDKILALQDEAKSYILSKIQDGETFELISKEELQDSDSDAVWDLPQVNIINKYDESCSYAIISIDRKGESLDLKGYGLGEYLGQSYIFSPYELTANDLCYLADYFN